MNLNRWFHLWEEFEDSDLFVLNWSTLHLNRKPCLPHEANHVGTVCGTSNQKPLIHTEVCFCLHNSILACSIIVENMHRRFS